MSQMMAAWRRRTGPQRFETYTRWTLYILLASVPLLALAVVGASAVESDHVPALIGYLGLIAAQVAVAIVVIHQGVTAFRDSTPLRRKPVLLLLVLTATAAGAAMLALPPSAGLTWEGRGGALLLALAAGLFALTPVLPTRVLMPAALGCSIVAAAANRPALDWPSVVTSATVFAIVMLAITPSFRISVWMLGVVWEQERTRQLHARLAVAEERLRFSRDLHDVVGRTLSAVALKSELAAELARRHQPETAAEQMVEVRELANDSLREVRAVVAGYRQADLPAELAGARSMLRAAGVRTRVIGEDGDLPAPVQSALAWVVREGVTNVVRHSSATTCTIDVSVQDDDGGRLATVAITNDGAGGRTRDTSASGLVGLAERLATVGGTIETEEAGDEFVLRARVPVTAPDDEPAGRTPDAHVDQTATDSDHAAPDGPAAEAPAGGSDRAALDVSARPAPDASTPARRTPDDETMIRP